jgi:hypothetical protein
MHNLVDQDDGGEESSSLEHSIVVDKCWKGYSNYPYIWILAGPMTAALLVSLQSFSNNLADVYVNKTFEKLIKHGKKSRCFNLVKDMSIPLFKHHKD